jgi:hypothetical protein
LHIALVRKPRSFCADTTAPVLPPLEGIPRASHQVSKSRGIKTDNVHVYSQFPDTLYKKSVHLNGAEDINMRHTDRKRNSPSCLYVPRVISYVGGRQGCWLNENGDASREDILRA